MTAPSVAAYHDAQPLRASAGADLRRQGTSMSLTVEQSALGRGTAEEPLVRVDRQGAIARLTLNRPGKYNVLAAAMIASLKEKLATLASDPEVRVGVIAAEGRAFSAGHDLTEMGPQVGLDELRALFSACT